MRTEAFGSEGMLTAGEIRESSMTRYNHKGVSFNTYRYDQDLFFDAYIAELRGFVDCVIHNKPALATAEDARWALKIALASIESVKSNSPIKLNQHVMI